MHPAACFFGVLASCLIPVCIVLPYVSLPHAGFTVCPAMGQAYDATDKDDGTAAAFLPGICLLLSISSDLSAFRMIWFFWLGLSSAFSRFCSISYGHFSSKYLPYCFVFFHKIFQNAVKTER